MKLHIKKTFLSHKPKSNSLLVALLSVAILFLGSQVYWQNYAGLAPLMPGIPPKVFDEGQWWRLVSSTLAHSDFSHFLANAIPFAVLSYLLYGYFGARVFPFLTLVVGCLVHALSLLTYPSNTYLVGASGIVYLMAGTWLALYICIDRRYIIFQRLLRASGFALIFFFPASFKPNVSYRTHGIGIAIGFVFGFLYFLINKKKIRAKEEIDPETDEEKDEEILLH